MRHQPMAVNSPTNALVTWIGLAVVKWTWFGGPILHPTAHSCCADFNIALSAQAGRPRCLLMARKEIRLSFAERILAVYGWYCRIIGACDGYPTGLLSFLSSYARHRHVLHRHAQVSQDRGLFLIHVCCGPWRWSQPDLSQDLSLRTQAKLTTAFYQLFFQNQTR